MEAEYNGLNQKKGRPKKKIKMTYRISIRFTETEHFVVLSKAKQSGIKLSEWVRENAIKARVIARFKPEDLKILRVLSGCANNLNQLTMKAHQAGLPLVLKECQEVIKEIDKYLKQLNKDGR